MGPCCVTGLETTKPFNNVCRVTEGEERLYRHAG